MTELPLPPAAMDGGAGPVHHEGVVLHRPSEDHLYNQQILNQAWDELHIFGLPIVPLPVSDALGPANTTGYTLGLLAPALRLAGNII